MSTKEKLEEEFFTCVVCHERLKEPVTLHCSHNFCSECLTSYTKTQPEAIATGSLPCPSCRGRTQVPDPSKPVDEWVKQLKTGFFVKGLMEAIGRLEPADATDVSYCSNQDRNKSDVTPSGKADSFVEAKLRKMKEEMKSALEKIHMAEDTMKENIDRIDSELWQAEKEVDNIANVVQDLVLKKAEKLKEEARTIHKAETLRLKGQIKSIQIEKDKLEAYLQSIDKTLESTDVNDKIKLSKRSMDLSKIKLDMFEEKTHIEFRKSGEKLVDELSSIGLGQVHTWNTCSTRVDVRNTRLVQKASISIRIPADKKEPFLRDVLATTLEDIEVIIIADSNNQSVKSFYGKKGHSRLKLPAGPCKMTKVSQTKGAVTLSNKSVLIYSITPDIKHDRAFRTSKEYYGIAWLNNATFAVGALNPVCIDIIDMDGNILKSLSDHVQDGLVFWCFQTPVFLCSNQSGNIIVSDYSSRQITILTGDLDTEHRFPKLGPASKNHLKNPLGVACSSNGDIFLVDRSREVVIQLDKEAKFVRNVLTQANGLDGSTCIFVDERDRLFIAVENNRVKTFVFE